MTRSILSNEISMFRFFVERSDRILAVRLDVLHGNPRFLRVGNIIVLNGSDVDCSWKLNPDGFDAKIFVFFFSFEL